MGEVTRIREYESCETPFVSGPYAVDKGEDSLGIVSRAYFLFGEVTFAYRALRDKLSEGADSEGLSRLFSELE